MNRIACLLLTVFLLPAMGATRAHARPAGKSANKAAKISWQPSYWAAKKASIRSGKPLFIDFYTDWCGPCKYMEETTYRDARFIAYSRGWVMVKINPEKSALGRKLAQKYRVQGFPTMIFSDGSGRKFGEVASAYPTNPLIIAMRKAARKAEGIRL